jgi:hypothetical protein
MSAAQAKTKLQALASSLDERDRAILQALVEYKVLSTNQVQILFFGSLRRCQHRLRELKDAGIIDSFHPPQDFGRGRSPEYHFLTDLGASVLAVCEGVPRGELPWVPDASYGENRNLAHRMGVNAFFCALVEASLPQQGHGLHRWRPERKVRTKAGEIQPDGFGRYLHPAGACQFYLEYDRATEGTTALTEKARGYLRFAAGWGEGAAFPNVLVLVPDRGRETDVVEAWERANSGTRRRASVPMFLTNEHLLAARGVLGPAWLPADSEEERLCLTELPVTDGSPYDLRHALGRYWTDPDRWSHISPISLPPRFPSGVPRRRE